LDNNVISNNTIMYIGIGIATAVIIVIMVVAVVSLVRRRVLNDNISK